MERQNGGQGLEDRYSIVAFKADPPNLASRVRFGVFELDRAGGILYRKGYVVRLQPQPMAAGWPLCGVRCLNRDSDPQDSTCTGRFAYQFHIHTDAARERVQVYCSGSRDHRESRGRRNGFGQGGPSGHWKSLSSLVADWGLRRSGRNRSAAFQVRRTRSRSLARASLLDRSCGGPSVSVLLRAKDRALSRQIYAQAWPGEGKPVRISPDGGDNSLWSHSGRELYYRRGDEMWAVAFDPAQTKPGTARRLFSGKYSETAAAPWNRDMLLSDGIRFLMLKTMADPPDSRRIQVVMNWFEELKKTVPR